MKQLELTPNQLYFCIILLEQDYFKKKEMFEEYAEKHGGFRWLEIDDLEKKGYITNFSDNEVPKTVSIVQTEKGKIEFITVKDVIILEMLIVTPHFKDQIYIDAEAATEELLSVYPAWVTIKNSTGSKITMLKRIGDRELFYQYYNTIINGDILKHKLIIEMFSHYKRFVEKGQVNGMNIKNALEMRLWEDIQSLIDKEEAEKDATKSI